MCFCSMIRKTNEGYYKRYDITTLKTIVIELYSQYIRPVLNMRNMQLSHSNKNGVTTKDLP